MSRDPMNALVVSHRSLLLEFMYKVARKKQFISPESTYKCATIIFSESSLQIRTDFQNSSINSRVSAINF